MVGGNSDSRRFLTSVGASCARDPSVHRRELRFPTLYVPQTFQFASSDRNTHTPVLLTKTEGKQKSLKSAQSV